MPRLRKLRLPSPATLIAGLALFVALSGTAYAVTTTQVNIADPTTPTQKAAVDATGALKVAGTSTVSGFVGPTGPKTPFHSTVFLATGDAIVMLGPNKATVALTRIDLANYFGQIDDADAEVTIYQFSTDSSGHCATSSVALELGTYDIPAGQTVVDDPANPIVIKPQAPNNAWCLGATLVVQGNPANYIDVPLSYNGYVISGSLPTGTVPGVARGTTATKPHLVKAH